ncbi:serine hydrolase [Bacillus sp. N1-1]|uniref:serine hydrolase n=1 Tax=Bacillus sp. N1-1 TaxID=2682541 RepID=UPI0013170ADF|nr:serine hydrolase [Bacillus sp. N1-1]QHA91036.1 serine hydrolase [Bacillus sp. N1-1]
MDNLIRISYGLLLVVILVVPTIAQAQNHQEDMLTDYMNEAMKKYQIPGASLGLVQNGDVVYQESLGKQSDGSPVTNKTLFSIGSISKPLTSLGILKLVEKGKIKLEAPIDTYIQFDYGQSTNQYVITVKQLLAHTSGISSLSGMAIADKNLRGSNALTEAVKELEPLKLVSKPGQLHQYSAANYLLLGKIIEEKAEVPFAEYMHEAVFKNLGMSDTVASYKSAIKLGYQPGFQSWFGKPVESDVWFDDSGAPYGYMASTLVDMLAFIRAVQYSDTLLSEPLNTLYTKPEVHRKENLYYGLGWRINKEKNEQYIFHGGETPDSRSEIFIHNTKDYAFVLLTNKNNFSEVMNTTDMKEGIREIIESEQIPSLPEPNHRLQWLTLFFTIIVTLLGIWNISRLYQKNLIFKKIWYIVAGVSVLLGVIMIPLLVQLFQSPWHTIIAYAPDTALLIKILIGVLVTYGLCSSIVISIKKK